MPSIVEVRRDEADFVGAFHDSRRQRKSGKHHGMVASAQAGGVKEIEEMTHYHYHINTEAPPARIARQARYQRYRRPRRVRQCRYRP